MTAAKWSIIYAEDVVKKDIPRLTSSNKQRIRTAIETKLMVDPHHFGKPLRYSLNHLRSFRVGDYRVLFQIDAAARLISIVAISHRRDVYDQ